MRHRMFRNAGVAAATHFVRRRRGLMLGALGASASNLQVAAFLQGAQTEGSATRRLIHSTPHRGAGWSRSIARFRKVPSASSTGHTDPDRAVSSDATDGGGGKDNNSPRGALDHDHVISIAESTGEWLLGKIEFARRQSLFYGGTSAIGVRVSLRRTVPPLLEDIFQLDDSFRRDHALARRPSPDDIYSPKEEQHKWSTRPVLSGSDSKDTIPQEAGYEFISLGSLPEWDSYGGEGQVKDCIDSDGQKMYRKMWVMMREEDVAWLRNKGCTLLDGWYLATVSDSTFPSSEQARATQSKRVHLPGVFKKPGVDQESGTPESSSFQHVYMHRVLEYRGKGWGIEL